MYLFKKENPITVAAVLASIPEKPVVDHLTEVEQIRLMRETARELFETFMNNLDEELSSRGLYILKGFSWNTNSDNIVYGIAFLSINKLYKIEIRVYPVDDLGRYVEVVVSKPKTDKLQWLLGRKKLSLNPTQVLQIDQTQDNFMKSIETVIANYIWYVLQQHKKI